MSSQIPPWLQDQIAKMQQTQQSLQSIMAQRQHLEAETAETQKALEELGKVTDDNPVYRHVGGILLKSTKKELLDDLGEAQEMAKTRAAVLSKQEERVKATLKEQEAKITELVKGGSGAGQPEAESRK